LQEAGTEGQAAVLWRWMFNRSLTPGVPTATWSLERLDSPFTIHHAQK